VTDRYPSNWDSKRRSTYDRDNYACQNCGIRGGPHGNIELHAHHIVPLSDGGSNNQENLVTLCKECHNAVHGNTTAPINRSSSTDQGGGISLERKIERMKAMNKRKYGQAEAPYPKAEIGAWFVCFIIFFISVLTLNAGLAALSFVAFVSSIYIVRHFREKHRIDK